MFESPCLAGFIQQTENGSLLDLFHDDQQKGCVFQFGGKHWLRGIVKMNIKGDSLTVATYVTSAAAITLMMATLITGAFRIIITPKAWTVILVSAFFPHFYQTFYFLSGFVRPAPGKALYLAP